MAGVIFFALAVLALVSCSPRGERGIALGAMLGVGAAIWLAIRFSLHSFLGSALGVLVTLAWEHGTDLLLLFAVGVVLIVPIFMIYVAAGDQMQKRAAASREKARLSQKGLGFVLRSEPWLWINDGSHKAASRFRKRNPG